MNLTITFIITFIQLAPIATDSISIDLSKVIVLDSMEIQLSDTLSTKGNTPFVESTHDRLVKIESILLSLLASAIFGIAVFIMNWLYFKYLLFRNVIGKYYKYYAGENSNLTNEVSATAEVNYSAMKELTITVTTFINEDGSLSHDQHRKFLEREIQKWTSKAAMVNSEYGNLYWYYISDMEEKFRSGFKKILFNRKLGLVKLFDENRDLTPEIFQKKPK